MIAFNKIREVLNESFFNDIDDETVNKSAEELESGSQEETEEYGYPNVRTQAQNCVFKTRANIYRSVGDSREQMINTQLNIYRMRKMMFIIFNNMKSVDTVSIKTDLNLISSAEIVDTIYDMVPTKEKPFCFEYFDMEAEIKKHPRLALYHNWWFDIEIHFSVNKEASYDTFISDISNMCNMMKRVHIDVDKDTEIYKEGGTKYGLMTKSYNSDTQLKNIYKELFDKDESDIKELKDTAEYWYDKLGVQDMIMNYIQNSDLNIINYDISIRALDADEDYPRRPIVITIFLKPEDKPYSINSVLHDIINHFIKVSNAWKDISMTVPFIFRIFDYKGRQMKTLKQENSSRRDVYDVTIDCYFSKTYNHKGSSRHSLNRLYNYSRNIDYKFGKEQNLFVAFPQKDGTITDGNLDIRGSGKCCHILKPKYFEKYDGRSYTDKDYLQSVMSNGTAINSSDQK